MIKDAKIAQKKKKIIHGWFKTVWLLFESTISNTFVSFSIKWKRQSNQAMHKSN